MRQGLMLILALNRLDVSGDAVRRYLTGAELKFAVCSYSVN